MTSGITANGVPFVAIPPEGEREARGVVILWHGADPPRSEEALAAAVPMRDLAAWRIYLGMPLYGRRMPEGGLDALFARFAADAVTLGFHPSIAGAVQELPEAVEDLRAQLSIDPALPLGIFGFSQGGAAALLAMGGRMLPFQAAVTWGAVTDFPTLVDYLGGLFGTGYHWNESRRSLADEINVAGRAKDLARSGAALLLGMGGDDPYPVHEPTERLAAEINAAGGTAEVRVLPGLAHAFVDEPGTEAALQGPAAQAIDEMATAWFAEHLI